MDPHALPKERGWKDLYTEALFEADKTKVASKIAKALIAIACRRRQLLVLGADIRERQLLDNAIFSLEALRTCLSIPALGIPILGIEAAQNNNAMNEISQAS